VNDKVKVTVYRWAGKKWFFRITGECVECDLVVGQVRRLLSAHPDWPVELEVKPWLTYLWDALRRSGWHPPVVLVGERLVRQGTIPTRSELEFAVRRALEIDNEPQAGWWWRVARRLPPPPS
jgi:hypothetical protein